MSKTSRVMLNQNFCLRSSSLSAGYSLMIIFIILIVLPAQTLAGISTPPDSSKQIQGGMVQETASVQGKTALSGQPVGQAGDQSAEVPPYLFRIGPVYCRLFDPSPAPRFIYAYHPDIDLTLVDKSDPDYPLLANKDMRESNSGHEEDIIKFEGFVDSSDGPKTAVVRNMPIDPSGENLPPFIPRPGEPVRYDPNSTYIHDLAVALQKAGYSVWPTVGLVLPQQSQILEDMILTCVASYRGSRTEQGFPIAVVSYPVNSLPPLIEPIQDQHIWVGDSLVYQVIAIDPDLVRNDQGAWVPRDQNGLNFRLSFNTPCCSDPGPYFFYPPIDPHTGFIHTDPIGSSTTWILTVTDPQGAQAVTAFNTFVEEHMIRYVCSGGRGKMDGLSWENACGSIQQAIGDAPSGGQVWVAEGVYKENIHLKQGIALYGGFQGVEQNLDQRNPHLYHATIDGGEREPVVIGSRDAILDGFTITNGQGTRWRWHSMPER
jgi:hypothetical protein